MAEFKYYVVTGKALETLKRYSRMLTDTRKQQDDLAEKYNNDAQAIATKDNALRRKMWVEMASSVGLDSDTSWSQLGYGVEIRFLKEGFGALVFHPPQPHPFSGMMPEDFLADMSNEIPPKGTKLN